MKSFGGWVVKHRIVILIVSVLLLIPSAIGYFGTRVNYDILSYLPKDIETMKGQEILENEFGTGAFSMVVVEGMDYKDVAKLKESVENVDHVKSVIWYDSVADLSFPVEFLPQEVRDVFNNGDATLMAVLFDTTMSSDETMDAIHEIRKVTAGQCFVSGMSAVVTDTKDLAEKEEPIYVLIAVLLSAIVLSLTMDSYLVPVFFLSSIGMAIIYNLGSNIFKGEISYITMALAAVLQLGVTMDYSIFLWHSYEENKETAPNKEAAMERAINLTLSSVISSSITTVAGFIALCFMSFTLGMDLGIVMAKGVVFGVIGCVTILPSMILVFDKALEKTRHKPLIPEFRISKVVAKAYIPILILFVLLWIPAVIGYKKTDVYYNLDSTLPRDLPSIVANEKLNENFEMNATHMLLVDSSMSGKDAKSMIAKIKDVDGVKAVIGKASLLGEAVPEALLPEGALEDIENDELQLMLVTSEYAVASDEVNAQCDKINKIVKSYDPKGMLIGEAPCTKDLIEITDEDFKKVSAVSIGVIFVIILLTFKSVSIPVLLVATIEFAIYVNMGIPYYTHTVIPFIASVVIGTIQLGSTVDYAILMTTRYRRERAEGAAKKEAVITAHQASIQSIFVSALSFFAATFGVGLYSDIDMISSLCNLMARGALISMVTVILVLPSLFLLFDKLIIATSYRFLGGAKTNVAKDLNEAEA
ncbi:MAG: MMPL family transporter [Lachnospiraceae bacterium]|nr:MMPL family transporter [Lachnospiraceae bacterium]